MERQLSILFVLMYFVLVNHAEKETEFSDNNLQDLELNYSYSYENGSEFAPCNATVPGFNSWGLTVIYITVFLFAVIGNSVVVFVVCNMRKRKTSTDIYLMHLAIADLLFCLTLPFWAVKVHAGWIFGNFLCKLLSGFQEASVYSGVFLLACISVDRYFAIVKATRVASPHHLLIKVTCSIVWLVATLLSLPVIIKKESIHSPDLEETICFENITGESSNHWRVTLSILRHTVGFFLPLGVMVVCYGWTVVTLFYTRNQQKHKAMRVILAVVLAFILCWLPYNAIVLVDTLMEGGSLDLSGCEAQYAVETVLKVTEVFAFMHCAVNPVLYAFVGQKFRNQLLSALHKHGLISKRLQVAYRKGSASSMGSLRSRNTSVTM